MTSHSTPNKYEVFLSVAEVFTVIHALEILVLVYIHVGLQVERGVRAGMCVYTCVHARQLFKLIALAHKTFWICLHS